MIFALETLYQVGLVITKIGYGKSWLGELASKMEEVVNIFNNFL